MAFGFWLWPRPHPRALTYEESPPGVHVSRFTSVTWPWIKRGAFCCRKEGTDEEEEEKGKKERGDDGRRRRKRKEKREKKK